MLSGIVVSTELEADIMLKQLTVKESIFIQHKAFCKGFLKGTVHAVVCICGVGKANAAHSVALLIERFKPELICNIGVAGAYPSSGLSIGDIVIAEKEIYGDEGVMLRDDFLTLDKIKLPLLSVNGIEYYNEFPMLVPEKLKGFNHRGNFVTVSTCTGTLKTGQAIEQRFNAVCENMEGAAVAHVCALSGIPVTEIRGISNIIEDRAARPLNKPDIIKAAENVQRFFLDAL